MKILVTGSAGFIGFHLTNRLLNEGYEVIGLDNLNNYYDVRLKLDRLRETGIEPSKVAYNEPVRSVKYPNYTFIQLSIENAANLERLFSEHDFSKVCHFAAQAGVRYSLKNPEAYLQSNIVGFFNILEACKHHEIKHLIYASSSSVYGMSKNVPFSEDEKVDQPISLYAATKKSNELMAYTYSHLYSLPTTGLRFFTVYGPWGRPDMAPMIFTNAIMKGEKIKVFNNGDMSRDFTFVGDIIEGVFRIVKTSPKKDYSIYNIGNNKPTNLMQFINILETVLDKKCDKEFFPLQDGDMKVTFADVSKLIKDFNYEPQTPLEDGLNSFVNWYRSYYK
ncbi:MAG: NAD-dependent epimerase/dehydratase family protein [Bacteroidetes bacterium]|nr:NAD-dependent epimerase/dehydratase family protein [Bacteroidota bacterium]